MGKNKNYKYVKADMVMTEYIGLDWNQSANFIFSLCIIYSKYRHTSEDQLAGGNEKQGYKSCFKLEIL